MDQESNFRKVSVAIPSEVWYVLWLPKTKEWDHNEESNHTRSDSLYSDMHRTTYTTQQDGGTYSHARTSTG